MSDRRPLTDGELTKVLLALNLTANRPFLDHFRVLIEAQRIYQDRYRLYEDIPIRRMGWRGCLVQSRTCVERLWALMTKGEWKLNDAIDLINYTVHYVRQGQAENENGTWWGSLDSSGAGSAGEKSPGEDRHGS